MADLDEPRTAGWDAPFVASDADGGRRPPWRDGYRMIAWGLLLLALGVGMVVETAQGAGGTVITYLAMSSPFFAGCAIIARALRA